MEPTGGRQRGKATHGNEDGTGWQAGARKAEAVPAGGQPGTPRPGISQRRIDRRPPRPVASVPVASGIALSAGGG
jgi:hypothetical protein